ncbi:MAG: hypothetical protein HY608_11110 [Planctomycetes bacterium]|nr:hypothetical protein [Planctomycetota bacterium]
MITRDELLASLEHETLLCKHLFSRLPDRALDYRPAPGMRTTLELLRYLSFAPLGFAKVVAVSNAFFGGDWSGFHKEQKRTAAMPSEGFPAEMDRQMEGFRTLLKGIPEEKFVTQQLVPPWGTNRTLGALLIDLCLKTLVAYRMQLFLYAKQAGNSNLNTGDCWAGVHYEDS